MSYQATTYGKCIEENAMGIKHDICAVQFKALMQCVLANAKVK